MQYTILEGDHKHLSEQVGKHLADGWTLYKTPYALNNVHYQAMVKGVVVEGELLQTAALNTEPITHTYIFDVTELKQTLNDFLIKVGEVVTKSKQDNKQNKG